MTKKQEEFYFVITLGEDGDIYIEKTDKEHLIEDMNDEYGDSEVLREQEVIEFRDQLNLVNPGKELGHQIIIKGTQVFPRIRRAISEMDID